MKKVEKKAEVTAAFKAGAAILAAPTPEFKPGDEVRWAPGMRNRQYPEYGETMIVTRVVPGRVDPERDPGDPTFGNPLDVTCAVDVQCGCGNPDCEMQVKEYAYDARRLQLAK